MEATTAKAFEVVEYETGVTREELVSMSRCGGVCAARRVLYEVLIHQGYTLSEIGRTVGRRDHTSVIAVIKNDVSEIVQGCISRCIRRMSGHTVPERIYTLEEIAGAVCRIHRVDIADIRSRRRRGRGITRPREDFCGFASERTFYSYPDIAKFLCSRSHSSSHAASVRYLESEDHDARSQKIEAEILKPGASIPRKDDGPSPSLNIKIECGERVPCFDVSHVARLNRGGK